MSMTAEEIKREAARLNAASRRRVETRCVVCGAEIEGLVQRKYCSDRCRMRAMRARKKSNRMDTVQREKAIREQQTTAKRPRSSEETEALIARLNRNSEKIMRGRIFSEDSVDTIREMREKRTTDSSTQ